MQTDRYRRHKIYITRETDKETETNRHARTDTGMQMDISNTEINRYANRQIWKTQNKQPYRHRKRDRDRNLQIQTCRQTYERCKINLTRQTEKKTDIQRGIYRYRHANGHIDRQAGRQADTETDKHIKHNINRHTDPHISLPPFPSLP